MIRQMAHSAKFESEVIAMEPGDAWLLEKLGETKAQLKAAAFGRRPMSHKERLERFRKNGLPTRLEFHKEGGQMKLNYALGSVRVQVIRERIDSIPLSEAKEVIRRFKHLKDSPKEELWAIFLDGRNQLLGDKLIGLGTSNSAITDVQDIARTALLLNAQGVILIHNHPSGIPKPSEDDMKSLGNVSQALNLFNITLCDYLIVGRTYSYSLKFNEEVRI